MRETDFRRWFVEAPYHKISPPESRAFATTKKTKLNERLSVLNRLKTQGFPQEKQLTRLRPELLRSIFRAFQSHHHAIRHREADLSWL